MIPPLYAHQQTALDLLKDQTAFALLMDMGTGKSRVIIEDWLRQDNMNLLVIAPKGVYRNWRGELDAYIPEEIKPSILVSHWVSGANKKDRISISNILKHWHGHRRVFLINIESLSSVKDAISAANVFVSSGDTMVVVDESTRIRNFDSKRTKTVIALGQKATMKRILSGLIAPRSPIDVYSQFFFLDWRILGFRNFYSFKARYAILKKVDFGGPRPAEIIVGYRNIDELKDKIKPFSYRVLKDECLDLPPKVYTERSVELSSEQARAYRDLKNTATHMLENGEYVTRTMAITMMQSLHQITYGHVKDDNGIVREIDASPRDDEMLAAIEECVGKVIIWACFRDTIVRICRLLRKEYGDESVVEYWGDTGGDERELAKYRFQNDPECRFFVGNQSTGGIGITLTAANMVIYYANSFDLEHRLQSEDRAHRSGLTHSVTYVDLVTQDTIEEKILMALRKKIDIAATITGEEAREWIR